MSASTDDPAEPVIIEGPAVPVEERDAVAAYALVADSKYGTNYGVAFYAAPENVCFRMTVLSAFGLSGDDFTGSPTRWTFDR